jgi:hypothetical protein
MGVSIGVLAVNCPLTVVRRQLHLLNRNWAIGQLTSLGILHAHSRGMNEAATKTNNHEKRIVQSEWLAGEPIRAVLAENRELCRIISASIRAARASGNALSH